MPGLVRRHRTRSASGASPAQLAGAASRRHQVSHPDQVRTARASPEREAPACDPIAPARSAAEPAASAIRLNRIMPTGTRRTAAAGWCPRWPSSSPCRWPVAAAWARVPNASISFSCFWALLAMQFAILDWSSDIPWGPAAAGGGGAVGAGAGLAARAGGCSRPISGLSSADRVVHRRLLARGRVAGRRLALEDHPGPLLGHGELAPTHLRGLDRLLLRATVDVALGVVVVVGLLRLFDDAARVHHRQRRVAPGRRQLLVTGLLGFDHLLGGGAVAITELRVGHRPVGEVRLGLRTLVLGRFVRGGVPVVLPVRRVLLLRGLALGLSGLESGDELIDQLVVEHHGFRPPPPPPAAGAGAAPFWAAVESPAFLAASAPAACWAFFLSPPNWAAVGVTRANVRQAIASIRTMQTARRVGVGMDPPEWVETPVGSSV